MLLYAKTFPCELNTLQLVYAIQEAFFEEGTGIVKTKDAYEEMMRSYYRRAQH